MNRIKNIPENEQPREKLIANGVANLADEELLAILIGTGGRKYDVLTLAEKMLPIIDAKGINLSIDDLMVLESIGPAKAATITAAFELVRRIIKPNGIKISTPSDILPQIQHYSNRKQEHFIAISVNGANEILNIRVVTIGLIDQSQVHPREIFADVISDRASGVILAHNHPTGSLEPSDEDNQITEKLKNAAEHLGLTILDHIIFNNTGYYSYLEDDKL